MIRQGVVHRNRKKHRFEVRWEQHHFLLPFTAKVQEGEIVRFEPSPIRGVPCTLVQSQHHNLPVFKVWVCVYDGRGPERRELEADYSYTAVFLEEARGLKMMDRLQAAVAVMKGDLDRDFQVAEPDDGFAVVFQLEKGLERKGNYQVVHEAPVTLSYYHELHAQLMAQWIHEHGQTIWKKMEEQTWTTQTQPTSNWKSP